MAANVIVAIGGSGLIWYLKYKNKIKYYTIYTKILFL